jgi:hypothetical protein
METKQPEWECIANIGDVNPIDHGGKFVLVDKTGAYAPEMEVLEKEYNQRNSWMVWRFIMEPHTYIDGVLSDNPHHPAMPVWYADDIASVATTCGITPDELIANLCSADPRQRAEGYYCLFTCLSADNFDSYPLTLDREEVQERYSEAPYNVEV